MDNSANQYEIKLPQFEGPFDLLLFFIQRDELDIHNIPISKITRDFFEYIQMAESKNIDLAGEFILVAATLMRIKAKMLLPRLPVDEEGNEIDPRQDLVRQLLEYKKFKEAANDLRGLEAERSLKVIRGGTQSELTSIAMLADGSVYNSELNSLTLFKLLTAFDKVMERFKINEERANHTIESYPFTIEQERDNIMQLVQSKPSVTFLDVFQSCQSKLHACFTFLALLDLLQFGEVGISIGEGFNNFFLSDANSEKAHAN